ncbi:MAG: hypothetical protein EOO92_07715 [Pedobacter sp.]|nr:MAG: hypothetical protein EOO92_07715 [Pedobacter sp.]
MRTENPLYHSATYLKCVFVLFYLMLVFAPDEKMSLPMWAVTILFFVNKNTVVVGIAVTLSCCYLFVTGFKHINYKWNFRLTIVCTTILALTMIFPLYYIVKFTGFFELVFVVIAGVMAAFIIKGNVVNLKNYISKDGDGF